MKKEVKCYRCGKVYDLNRKTIEEVISCGHCHQTMRITKKSRNKFNIIRFLFILILSSVVTLLVYSLESTYKILILLAFLMIIILAADKADRGCLILTYYLFGLEYEEYHEIKKTKKELRKEVLAKNNKKKKRNKK